MSYSHGIVCCGFECALDFLYALVWGIESLVFYRILDMLLIPTQGL